MRLPCYNSIPCHSGVVSCHNGVAIVFDVTKVLPTMCIHTQASHRHVCVNGTNGFCSLYIFCLSTIGLSSLFQPTSIQGTFMCILKKLSMRFIQFKRHQCGSRPLLDSTMPFGVFVLAFLVLITFSTQFNLFRKLISSVPYRSNSTETSAVSTALFPHASSALS